MRKRNHPYCRRHPATKPVIYCPACRGEARSDAKAQAARKNGLAGGRKKNPTRLDEEAQDVNTLLT